MTASRGIRKSWTARQRHLVAEFAKERLSITRTAVAMRELHGVDITAKQVGALATYFRIKFHGDSGPPYGNTNRRGHTKVSRGT